MNARISLTLGEAKETTGISVRALQYAIDSGELIARYNGTRPILRVEDLERYVDALPKRPVKRKAS